MLFLVLFCREERRYCLNKQAEPEEPRKTRYVTRRFSLSVRRGWFSHQPGHSCKDIRDSGDSKGDGEYWIDPENTTNPLLVYCDMTTDGGKLGLGHTRRIFFILQKYLLSLSFYKCARCFCAIQTFVKTYHLERRVRPASEQGIDDCQASKLSDFKICRR